MIAPIELIVLVSLIGVIVSVLIIHSSAVNARNRRIRHLDGEIRSRERQIRNLRQQLSTAQTNNQRMQQRLDGFENSIQEAIKEQEKGNRHLRLTKTGRLVEG